MFDWDGVFIEAYHPDRLRLYDERLGLTPGSLERAIGTGDAWRQRCLGHLSDDDYWDEAGRLLGCDLDAVRREIEASARLNQPLVALATRLHQRYRLALLANEPDSFEDDLIERYRLGRLFDTFVLAGQAGVTKPNPAIFLIALERLFVAPEETLLVDDQERNLVAIRSLGLRGLLYKDMAQLEADLREMGVVVE